jgi:glycosyltransferase involved in cell wall biosynthesis
MCAESVDISVVMPSYNEAECVEAAVREVAGVLRRLDRPFEILVVDDGSRDGTFDVLKRAARELPELRALRLAVRRGQSAALFTGFRHARGGIVVTLDADLQNDPADIPKLLAELERWDAVCGVRTQRRDPLVRRVSARVANAVRNRLTHETIRDTGCSLRVCKRAWLGRLPRFDGMHRFLPTLLKTAGARVTELPVNHRPRRAGRSKYGVWNRILRAGRDLLAVRWMQRRWLRAEIAEEIGGEEQARPGDRGSGPA